MHPRTKKIYSNCALYDFKGLLCRCSFKRANWYVKRGLAKVISEKPYQVMLTFDPEVSMEQREVVYSIYKENICCVCKSDDLGLLTRHHIVPFSFRKKFPESYKSCMSHDIVPVCDDCHKAYHQHAKAWLNDMYKKCPEVELNRERKRKLRQILSMCKALQLGSVPESRKKEVRKDLYSIWDKKHTVQQIVNICLEEKRNFKTDSDIYFENLPVSLDEFILSWRLHFVDTMKPPFLPKGWSLDHKTHN